MKYLQKHWSSILFVVFIILMIIPATRMPIQVVLLKTISLSPTEIKKEDIIKENINEVIKKINSSVKYAMEGMCIFAPVIYMNNNILLTLKIDSEIQELILYCRKHKIKYTDVIRESIKESLNKKCKEF